jgi:hypothetical protein
MVAVLFMVGNSQEEPSVSLLRCLYAELACLHAHSMRNSWVIRALDVHAYLGRGILA